MTAAVLAAGCTSGDPRPPQSEPATESKAEPATELAAASTTAAPVPVESPCPQSEVPEDMVSLCLVAYGDPSLEGSGPHRLIPGVRIAVLRFDAASGGDPVVWWDSVASSRIQSPLPGERLQSSAERIAAAEAPSVVTGEDGTAHTAVQLRGSYQVCAVHPDEPGLIAGCSAFAWLGRQFPYHPGHHSSLIDLSDAVGAHRALYVYFSHGRAFFHTGAESERYDRFLAGATHLAGTGRITFTGFDERDNYSTSGVVRVFLDDVYTWTLAVVEDADVGAFWDAVHAGWNEQWDLELPHTWAPARLLSTGADGAASADLAAGDYLFCWPNRDGVGPCTYQDVTAGQDRILLGWTLESYGGLTELTEQQSADLLHTMATCTPPWCATREQYERATAHFWETGDYPDDW